MLDILERILIILASIVSTLDALRGGGELLIALARLDKCTIAILLKDLVNPSIYALLEVRCLAMSSLSYPL